MLSSRILNRLSDLGRTEWHDEFCIVSKEPAILIVDGLDGKRNTLVVVWYDSERRGQFEFHLTVSLEKFEKEFATHPEMGTVIYLGQVKDWPNEKTREQIVKELHFPSDDACVVHWIVPIGMGRDEKGELLPVSCTCGVILSYFPEYGLLRPENYHSEEAKRRVMDEFCQLVGRPQLMSKFLPTELLSKKDTP